MGPLSIQANTMSHFLYIDRKVFSQMSKCNTKNHVKLHRLGKTVIMLHFWPTLFSCYYVGPQHIKAEVGNKQIVKSTVSRTIWCKASKAQGNVKIHPTPSKSLTEK